MTQPQTTSPAQSSNEVAHQPSAMAATQPALILSVTEQADGTVGVQVRHAHPVPSEFGWALSERDSIFWQVNYRDEDDQTDPNAPAHGAARVPKTWTQRTDEVGLVMERTLDGVWALGKAVSWCGSVFHHFGQVLSLYQGTVRPKGEPKPPYPMAFEFNGRFCRTLEELEAAHLEKAPEVHFAGVFELTQPTLRVTDPCYGADTWCATTLEALPGNWTAQTLVGPTAWLTRVWVLQVHHDSLGTDVPLKDWHKLEATGINAGVDSGQCGFFDDARYPRDAAQLAHEPGTFYRACCDATLNENNPGGKTIRNMGAVSSSGFGDGGYNVYVERNARGEVVLAQLVFIGDRNQQGDD